MPGMDRSTPGCKTFPQRWLSRSLLAVEVCRSPSPKLLGFPGVTAGPGWCQSEVKGEQTPTMMGAGAGSKMSSRRAGTGLSSVMVPIGKSGRSPEAWEHRRKWWRKRAEAAWEERVSWLQHTSTRGLPRQAVPEAERWVLGPRSSWDSPGATKSGWSHLGR